MSILSVVGEIDRAGRAINALREIERLHAPVQLKDGTLVCVLCCLDTGGYRTDECEDSHEHGGPVCSTAEIIARAAL